MTKIANRMLEISNRAIAAKESQTRVEVIRHQETLRDMRRRYEDQAEELFSPILQQITSAANNGIKSTRVHYNGENDADKIRMRVISETAENHGFRTNFRSEESNMGDFAAPAWYTHYWLEISW